MSVSSTTSPGAAKQPPAGIGGVSRYDRVAGLIVSSLAMLGVSVAVLLFVWLGSKFVARTKTVPVVLQAESPGGSPTGLSSDGMTLDAPTVQEIQRETQIALPEFRRSLAAVDDLLATRRTELDATLGLIEAESTGGGKSTGTGNAPAFGSGPGRAGLSRSQRWEIRFSAGSVLDDYRRELDFFQIELAAAVPDGRTEYARRFTQTQPTVERDRTAPETRLYMQWRRGSARLAADRELLESAGVATAGKLLVQFIPPDLEERLARLEYDFARRDAAKIRKTRFATRPAGKGFEFFVEEQIPF